MPEGTIYAKGKEWYFDDLCIKAQSWDNDWIYLDMRGPESKDSGEYFDRLDEMLNTGVSYPANSSFGRDGGFDDDELFLVFETDDLIQLKTYIEEALIVSKEST